MVIRWLDWTVPINHIGASGPSYSPSFIISIELPDPIVVSWLHGNLCRTYHYAFWNSQPFFLSLQIQKSLQHRSHSNALGISHRQIEFVHLIDWGLHSRNFCLQEQRSAHWVEALLNLPSKRTQRQPKAITGLKTEISGPQPPNILEVAPSMQEHGPIRPPDPGQLFNLNLESRSFRIDRWHDPPPAARSMNARGIPLNDESRICWCKGSVCIFQGCMTIALGSLFSVDTVLDAWIDTEEVNELCKILWQQRCKDQISHDFAKS